MPAEFAQLAACQPHCECSGDSCLNSFQTTRTPNPEKLCKCYYVKKQSETCVWMCSSNAFKLRCLWFGNCSLLRNACKPLAMRKSWIQPRVLVSSVLQEGIPALVIGGFSATAYVPSALHSFGHRLSTRQWLHAHAYLLRLSLLRFVDSEFPGNSLWTWEFYPLQLGFCLSQALWSPES